MVELLHQDSGASLANVWAAMLQDPALMPKKLVLQLREI
jgi:hypothetical protein